MGPVTSKRMFGGYGFFLEGLMFALMANDELYLKADNQSEHEFENLGLEPFTYHKKDKVFQMSYYQAPEDVYENPEQMTEWANRAYAAAVRAAKNKATKRKSNP